MIGSALPTLLVCICICLERTVWLGIDGPATGADRRLGLGGRDLADPDFVAVGIVEDVLARLAVVLKLRGLDAAPADRLCRRFEVGDHDGGERAASLRRVLQEIEPTVLAYRPY